MISWLFGRVGASASRRANGMEPSSRLFRHFTSSSYPQMRSARPAATFWRAVATSMRSTLVAILTSNLRHRSEEHTSELQSQSNLVCRLLLEKKKGTLQNRGLRSREIDGGPLCAI